MSRCEFGLPDIAQFADADRHRLAAGKARARMRREILGEFRSSRAVMSSRRHPVPGALFAPGDPLRDIVGEVRLRQFAVIDDVEAALDLSLDDFRDRRLQPPSSAAWS